MCVHVPVFPLYVPGFIDRSGRRKRRRQSLRIITLLQGIHLLCVRACVRAFRTKASLQIISIFSDDHAADQSSWRGVCCRLVLHNVSTSNPRHAPCLTSHKTTRACSASLKCFSTRQTIRPAALGAGETDLLTFRFKEAKSPTPQCKCLMMILAQLSWELSCPADDAVEQKEGGREGLSTW